MAARLTILILLATMSALPATATIPAGQLIIATAADPVSLDPSYAVQPVEKSLAFLAVEPLVMRGDNLTFRPALATSWEFSADGRRIRFNLRSNARFADGTPFNASDALASSEQRCQGIKGGVRINPTIFEIPVPNPASTLSSLTLVGMRPVREARDPRFDSVPNGTGPYRVVTHAIQREIIFQLKRDYWGPLPQISQITVRVLSNEDDRLSALLSGQVHLATGLSPSGYMRLRQTPGIVADHRPTTRLVYVQMNTNSGPFRNPIVRRALASAINRDAINFTATQGLGRVAESLLNPNIPGFVRQSPYEVSTERARAFLREAGLTAPVRVTLAYSRDVTWNSDQVARLIAQQLRSVGFDVSSVSLLTTSELRQQAQRQRYDIILSGERNITLDPQVAFAAFKQGNFMGYSDPYVSQLIDSAGTQAPGRPPQFISDQALTLYGELQQRLWTDVVQLPLFFEPQIMGSSASLRGITLRPDGLILLSRVSFAR